VYFGNVGSIKSSFRLVVTKCPSTVAITNLLTFIKFLMFIICTVYCQAIASRKNSRTSTEIGYNKYTFFNKFVRISKAKIGCRIFIAIMYFYVVIFISNNTF
jgi:hypothetical protein